MPIGLTGESKYSGFDHIHFEIRDEVGGYEKYSVNPFGRMPYTGTDDYEIKINQVSVEPTNPANPTTVLLTVTGPRQELDLNRFTVSIDGSERVLNFNDLNRTQTPAPNDTEPDVLDNPYQNDICIMPARFNTSSDLYRLNLAFHQMPGNPPYVITAQAADLFSNTVTATQFSSGELKLTPAVVTATTPTGRWVTHTHTLTNASPTPQIYTLTARSAQSWTVTIEPSTVVTLASGESVTFTTSISVPNNGYIVTDTIDCVVVETVNTAVVTPQLSISKIAMPNSVAPGGLITYTLTVTNTGGTDATGVVITDILPANTQFAGASDGGSQVGNVVQWTNQTVPKDSSISRTFTVTVTAPLINCPAITNANYGVTSAEGISAVGSPVTTSVNWCIYLPTIMKN